MFQIDLFKSILFSMELYKKLLRINCLKNEHEHAMNTISYAGGIK